MNKPHPITRYQLRYAVWSASFLFCTQYLSFEPDHPCYGMVWRHEAGSLTMSDSFDAASHHHRHLPASQSNSYKKANCCLQPMHFSSVEQSFSQLCLRRHSFALVAPWKAPFKGRWPANSINLTYSYPLFGYLVGFQNSSVEYTWPLQPFELSF